MIKLGKLITTTPESHCINSPNLSLYLYIGNVQCCRYIKSLIDCKPIVGQIGETAAACSECRLERLRLKSVQRKQQHDLSKEKVLARNKSRSIKSGKRTLNSDFNNPLEKLDFLLLLLYWPILWVYINIWNHT